MRRPSLTNFYNLVPKNTIGNLARLGLMPILLLFTFIATGQLSDPLYGCDTECPEFASVTLCYENTSGYSEPIFLSSSDNLYYKPIADECPVEIALNGPASRVFTNTGGDEFCSETLYVPFGEMYDYTVGGHDSNGDMVTTLNQGYAVDVVAPSTAPISISADSEACVSNADDAVFTPIYSSSLPTSDFTFYPDPNITWLGWVDLFDNDQNNNDYLCSGVVGSAMDLQASYSDNVLTLSPSEFDVSTILCDNESATTGRYVRTFFYGQEDNAFAGESITYAVDVTHYDLSCGHTSYLYIREFDLSSNTFIETTTEITGTGIFYVTMSIVDGDRVQFGHKTYGLNTDGTIACGSIDFQPVGLGQLSLQDSNGLEISNSIVTHNEDVSFDFPDSEGEYTIEYIIDSTTLDDENDSPCFSTTSTTFSVVDPSASEISGDTYVCNSDDTVESYTLDFDGYLDCIPEWTLEGSDGNYYNHLLVDNRPNRNSGMTIGVNWPDADPDLSPYTLTLECDATAITTCSLTTPVTAELTLSDGTANQMACNNLVNITLNANCELIINPDMILEGIEGNEDQFSIVVTDIATGDELPDVLDYSHVGNTYQVMVVEDCSQNSCWGYIKVEDKGIPALDCPEDIVVTCDEFDDLKITGIPTFDDDVNISIESADPLVYRLENFDNCTDAYLSYADVITAESCDEGVAGTIITRTFTVTDELGHSSSCFQEISIIRPEVTSLLAPPSWDNNVAGANPAIDLCDLGSTVSLDDNDNPHPDYTGYPTGLTCMNVSIEGYDDVVELPLCGDGSGARKIIREWSVYDSCTETSTILKQIISVVDDTPPVTVCLEVKEIFVDANPYDCAASVDLAPYPGSGGLGEIRELQECSDYTIEVFYLEAEPGTDTPVAGQLFTSLGMIDGPDSVVTVPETEGKQVWITYRVEDACGNTLAAEAVNGGDGSIGADLVSCFFEITYDDVTPPQPVCDLYSVVSVGTDGCTLVGPQSFNDGSHDNCSDELTFEVQRMDDFNGSNYTDYVEFCCSDVSSSPIMVILNVTDEAGLSSSCMVEVSVTDPIGPTLESCPADITVDCEDTRINNLSDFGTPTYGDNCGGTLNAMTPDLDIDKCGFGTIIRSWSYTDEAGNVASTCTQKITVNNETPYIINQDDWPLDTTVDCNGSIDPDDTGRPIINAVSCSDPLANYADTTFGNVIGGDYCHKILRNWTIIDWCNQGQTYSHTQVIRIEDTELPSISCPKASASGDFMLSSCTQTIELIASGSDNCTATEDLTWYYTIDLNNDGSTSSRSGNDASGNYPVGSHTVTFYAEDECGNVDSCPVSFAVSDNILPTPYCLDQVVTVISVAKGHAEIWAIDLNAGSYDNCYTGSPSDVDISFSQTPGDLVRYFDCDDLANGIVDTFDIDVYVIDEDGNYDYCTSRVIVQDNNDLCTDIPGEGGDGEGGDTGNPDENSRVAISGHVVTEDVRSVNDVMINLTSNQPEFPLEKMVEVGQYVFSDLPANESYMVSPQKSDNHANGVSTLDIILIQRHILNIQNLDTPYKLIAADANNSGDVSAADMVDIRKLILEIYSEYPSNESWRFVEQDFAFVDPTQPFPFEENVDLIDIANDALVDFIGVKVGDVNQSVAINGISSESVETRGSQSLKMHTSMRTEKDGKNYIDIVATETSRLYGFQFALEANSKLSDIQSGTIQIEDYNMNLSNADKGLITMSWNDTKAIEVSAGDVLFTLIGDAKTTELALDAYELSPEAYILGDNEEINIMSVTFDSGVGTDFALYQNMPNPFSELTTIGFSIPVSQSVTLKVMDVRGQVLYSITDTYTKGGNEVVFDASLVNSAGILYYQIETDTHSSTKKMVVLK